MTDYIDFPNLSVEKQLFHVPGAAIDGGFTSGGARIMSPEPGGRSMLEFQIAMQIAEWERPETSWLMSKINGSVFRVKLAMTPQIITSASVAIPNNGTEQKFNDLYDNRIIRPRELFGKYLNSALEGTVQITVDMSQFGPILKRGHAIGHGNNCYMVDSISYDNNGIATAIVMPPLRKDISAGDTLLFRPYFLGTISNGANFRVTYDAGNVGMIQPGQITFNESIV